MKETQRRDGSAAHAKAVERIAALIIVVAVALSVAGGIGYLSPWP
jgi:hypothetical protein